MMVCPQKGFVMLPIVMLAAQNFYSNGVMSAAPMYQYHQFVCDGARLMRDPGVDWTKEGPRENLMIKILAAIQKTFGADSAQINTAKIVPLFTNGSAGKPPVFSAVAVFLPEWTSVEHKELSRCAAAFSCAWKDKTKTECLISGADRAPQSDEVRVMSRWGERLKGTGVLGGQLVDADMVARFAALAQPTSVVHATERQASILLKKDSHWEALDALTPKLPEADFVALYADGTAPRPQASARLSHIELTATTHDAATAAPPRRPFTL